MSTVVQGAKDLVVESGTAVVTQVLHSTTGDLNAIEGSAVKEAVLATHEPLPSLIGKAEDGLADVATKVVKDAESSAVETVKQHPELIAEGALAVVVGAASLVLPELVPAEVALIGKMAAGAKKTVTTIASETGSKVVKDISKDLADDVKEQQTKDVAAELTKKNGEGPKDGETVIPEASNPKAATVETVKDGPKGSILSPPDTKATPDPNSATLGAANLDSNGSTSSPSDTQSTPAGDTAPKDKTVVIELAQEPSKVTSNGDRSSLELEPDSLGVAPVSLKITLGADGEVKAVTRDPVAKSNSTERLPTVESTTSTTTSFQTTTKAVMLATEATKEKDMAAPKTAPSIPQPAPISENKAETVQAAPQTIKDTSKDIEEVAPQAMSPISKPAPVSEQKTGTTNHGLLQATDTILSVPPRTVVAAVAKVTNTFNTIPKATPQETTTTTEGSRMVTISQESLDLLHQKIDNMNDAIQQITKALAFHMPMPPLRAAGSNAIEDAEAIINEALATAVKPLTDLVPEIMAKSNDLTYPPSEDPSTPKSPPTRPNPQKRPSVISSIGKAFWPFGFPEKVATVTVTEVSSDRIEVGV